MAVVYRTRNLFLRSIAAIYLFAFTSLYLQIRGLYGPNGILPAHTQLNFKDKRPLMDKFWEQPTLLHLAPVLGLNVSYSMELLSLVGMLLSFLGVISQAACNAITFSILWIVYLSLFKVGQTFMHFQWDIMLLETGIITILVAPLMYNKPRTVTPKDHLTFWLVKWLFFRLMFASGVVKLTSKCPTWWGLTALTVHYESQCIPTMLAWSLHQLPVWFQKLSVVATFVIEIGLPFLFFAPFRRLRLFACYGQVLLQVLIIASGNYNFFNLLTLTFCFSLFDDYHLFSSSKLRIQTSTIEKFATLLVTLFLFYLLRVWFGLDFGRGDDVVHSEITFSMEDFEEALKTAVPFSVMMGTACFALVSFSALYSIVFESNQSGFSFIKRATQFLVYFPLTAALFGISLVPYTTLDRATHAALPHILHRWHHHYDQFNIAGSYGLFRSMTGVGGRPELILEGAARLEGPWTEISFKYKPGALDRSCPFIVPHQPRLDWQMWFAALGNYHRNPWLTSLAYRLLTNETDVVKLLDVNIYNEFEEDWPPKYVKGSLYTYKYTSPTHKTKENWWKRTRVDDYLPIFSANHEPLLDYLAKLKIIRHPDLKIVNTKLASILDSIWNYFSAFEPHIVIWGLFISGLVINRFK